MVYVYPLFPYRDKDMIFEILYLLLKVTRLAIWQTSATYYLCVGQKRKEDQRYYYYYQLSWSFNNFSQFVLYEMYGDQ